MRSDFSSRHIGPSEQDIGQMLTTLKVKNLDELIEKSTPQVIRTGRALDIGPGLSEESFLSHALEVAKKNKVFKNYIGLGYYGTNTPLVILRNILENPGWYTAYTPYQAEISQGRMEALLNFQTMIKDLTGLEISNASLLDEGTAAAEAMSLSFYAQKKNVRNKLFVDADTFPQTIEVIRTRAEPLDIEVVVGDFADLKYDNTFFAAIVQYPNAKGHIKDYRQLAEVVHKNEGHLIVAADLLSLTVLTPPGEWGADICIGTSQRFGVPIGFGGPHAAYFATKEAFARMMPGRIIGVSKDSHGNPAMRLALQTREQHIRREKATSNICTAQVLLAVMASMYAVYHGPKGLKAIAERVHNHAVRLSRHLKLLGFETSNEHFFDTVSLHFSTRAERDSLLKHCADAQINIGQLGDNFAVISVDETTSTEDLVKLHDVCARAKGKKSSFSDAPIDNTIDKKFLRQSDYLTHPTFNRFHSETEMLRYIHRLERKDLALNHSMIPLGSCTMKLNATAEMTPVTWQEFGAIHPFAPSDQTAGYREMIHQLEKWLCDITGFAGVSLQPNAGSQGEYAGLLVIRAYLKSKGEGHRKICLIPSSAHGTNPASAVMAGFQVVVVKCDDAGNVDIDDLKAKAEQHKLSLGALMVTYPSTHGVFEETISDICKLIHDNGGQVYMDGANMNALVGVARPGEYGADVCHLNLHKTFCIPHGGGGPGVGPIGVGPHLKDFLPAHSLVPECGPKKGIGAVASAPWGSASILPISWAYIAMMGSGGLKKSTQVAILNANYIASRLAPFYPVVYKGRGGWVAHECIIDVRQFKATADITVDDIAKRLIDYGFHAPTMSWPVAGTLMIEPTESESLEELNRFCEAMISIRKEIEEIELGRVDKVDNMLKCAPHTADHIASDNWKHPYGRTQAAYPLPWIKEQKFWPSVGRVDNVYGDRNLMCECPPVTDYA
jgi:glycine dehydrogenase